MEREEFVEATIRSPLLRSFSSEPPEASYNTSIAVEGNGEAKHGSGRPGNMPLWKFSPEHFLSTYRHLHEDSTLGVGKREFYRRQHELLMGYQESDRIFSAGHPSPGGAEELENEATEKAAQVAILFSNYGNIVLLLLKIYAVYVAHSLAVIASTLDSLLDLLAGGVLLYTAWSMAKKEPSKFPIGKKRMQPVGVVVFSAIMATLGLQIMLEGVKQLTTGGKDTYKMSNLEVKWVSGLLGFALVTKFFLFIWCRTFKDSIVQAYAQDHLFDVITNAVSLISTVMGQKMVWWVDPVGAILIALYTIVNWSNMMLENAESLVGLAATPDFLSKLTYIAFNHDERIQRIDTVRAWTLGEEYVVEIDVELPEEMVLREAHDIGESLQNKLEALPEVDRAFVHLDYESRHPPEHSMGPFLIKST